MTDNVPSNNNRRAALKALAAATGAVGLAALPTHWSKPTLMVGAVPAHAQTSCTDFAIIFDIAATEAAGTGDFFLSWNRYPAPDSQVDGVAYWNCGGGCVALQMSNGGDGTYTPVITLFGSPLATPTLALEEDFWLVVNRNTLQFNTANTADPPDSLFTDIGCTRPT